jgi:hypothetical protein
MIIFLSNYFFGFFLFVPQVGLWLSIHYILVLLTEKSWSLDYKVIDRLGSKIESLTIDDIKEIHAEFLHVRNDSFISFRFIN